MPNKSKINWNEFFFSLAIAFLGMWAYAWISVNVYHTDCEHECFRLQLDPFFGPLLVFLSYLLQIGIPLAWYIIRNHEDAFMTSIYVFLFIEAVGILHLIVSIPGRIEVIPEAIVNAVRDLFSVDWIIKTAIFITLGLSLHFIMGFIEKKKISRKSIKD